MTGSTSIEGDGSAWSADGILNKLLLVISSGQFVPGQRISESEPTFPKWRAD